MRLLSWNKKRVLVGSVKLFWKVNEKFMQFKMFTNRSAIYCLWMSECWQEECAHGQSYFLTEFSEKSETCFCILEFKLKAYLCNIYVNVPIHYEWFQSYIAEIIALQHLRKNQQFSYNLTRFECLSVFQSPARYWGMWRHVCVLPGVGICSYQATSIVSLWHHYDTFIKWH